MPRPVVFIHGLWLHGSSWQPWIDLFRSEGYDPIAPAWPGEHDSVAATRADPDAVAGTSIDDAFAHFAAIVDGLAEPPILVGHSLGGLLVEKLLGENRGAAAVAIDPAQIKGVHVLPLTQLVAGLPIMINPTNIEKAVSLTSEQFRFAFGNAVSQAESDELYEKWTIPSAAKPLFQTATVDFQVHSEAAVNTANENRGPLLLVSGTEDHTEPEAIADSTLKRYRDSSAVTEIRKFAGRGHSITIDSGWHEVATEVLGWLKAKGF